MRIVMITGRCVHTMYFGMIDSPFFFVCLGLEKSCQRLPPLVISGETSVY